jgi:hypothetical protein
VCDGGLGIDRYSSGTLERYFRDEKKLNKLNKPTNKPKKQHMSYVG